MISMGLLPMLIFCVTISPDSLRQFHLHPVRVIAEGEEASVSPISRVLNPPNNTPISEVLKQSSGISMSYGSRDESNLRIRGFRKNESLILIDGRPQNSGYFGNVDLSKILSDEIAEIRIIKGPASALYGSGTMGGVLNIITKRESHLFKLESNLHRNLRNSQKLSTARDLGTFAYHLSLIREERPGFALSKDFEPTVFENGGLRDHSVQTSYQGRMGLDFWIDELHEMGISAGHTRIPYKEIPSSIYSRDYRVYKDWQKSDAAVAWDIKSSLSTGFRGQLYLDSTADTFERYNDPSHQAMLLSSRMEAQNFGFAPIFEYRSRGTLSSGLRLEHRTIKRRDTGSYLNWTKNDAFVGSIFSQYQRDLSESMSFSLSAGITGFSHSQDRDLKLIFEPSAGVFWDHPDGSHSSLSLGLNSALPTMRQLFSADSGNPDLIASRAVKSELGHQRALGLPGRSAAWDINLYYNVVRDLIDRPGERYENIYEVETYGFETSLSALLCPIWEFSVQYAFLGTWGDYVLSDSAPHGINIQSRIKLPHSFNLNLDSMWRSKRKSQDSISMIHELDAYHTHEVGLSRTFGKLELHASMQNIFDHDYQSEYGYPAPGRDFHLRIIYTFR